MIQPAPRSQRVLALIGRGVLEACVVTLVVLLMRAWAIAAAGPEFATDARTDPQYFGAFAFDVRLFLSLLPSTLEEMFPLVIIIAAISYLRRRVRSQVANGVIASMLEVGMSIPFFWLMLIAGLLLTAHVDFVRTGYALLLATTVPAVAGVFDGAMDREPAFTLAALLRSCSRTLPYAIGVLVVAELLFVRHGAVARLFIAGLEASGMTFMALFVALWAFAAIGLRTIADCIDAQ